MATMSELRPFHFAFIVTDLASTRHFYGEILGCAEGRSTATWIDFDFFGSQISAHLGTPPPAASTRGEVDGVTVPMPHFGAVLEWSEFHALADRLREAGIGFLIEPYVRYEGAPGEQATMFLSDPSGNPLEFKSFRASDAIFAR